MWCVMGMCVHRVGDWVAGDWNHCPVDRELPWACGRGEGAAGEGRGCDGSACESVAGRGQWAVGMGCVMGEGGQGKIGTGEEGSVVNRRGMCLCVVDRGCSWALRCVWLCLGIACVRGHACLYVRVCLQRDGRTALYQASQQGKEEVVEVLVSYGAAANVAEVRCTACDSEWCIVRSSGVAGWSEWHFVWCDGHVCAPRG